MAATAEQIKTPEIIPESPHAVFDRSVQLIPAFDYYVLKPVDPDDPPKTLIDEVEYRSASLIAFNANIYSELKGRDLADEIERTLGYRCDTDQSTFAVPRTFVDGERIVKNGQEIDTITESGKPGEIAGYYGIRLYKDGVEGISPEDAAAIAAMIAERYEGDEALRTLNNYTADEPNEPIEITGPGYNLAQSTTAEHPAIGIEDLVKEHPEVRWQRVAPDLSRVAFA